MLIHQENGHRIREYEAVLFYTGRIARSYWNNCSSYSYIIAIIAKFQTTGQGYSLQLECQTVDIWLVAVQDRKSDSALRFR